MRKNPFRTKLGILAIVGSLLLSGTVFLFVSKTFAFNGPSQNPSGGSGAIGSDSSNNVSIGTQTTISGTKLVVVGASNDNTTYAEKILENNQTSVFLLRDDGTVSIATSTVTAGDTIIGNNLIVGGTFTANGLSGIITAGNVSAGQFGSNTGGGNYSFPGGLTVANGEQLSGNNGLLMGNGYYGVTQVNATTLQIGSGAGWTNGIQFSTPVSGTSMFISGSTGNVGIGTASPWSTLSVNGYIDANPSDALRLYNGSTFTGGLGSAAWGLGGSPTDEVLYASNNLFLTSAGGNIRMTVASGGNVGIGTASPSYKLDVAGAIRTSSGGIVFPDGTTQTTAFLGGSSQTITAGNVSAGTFGSNTGGGTYTFSGNLQVDGWVNTSAYIDTPIIYNQGNYNILNKAGTAWLTFAVRDTGGSEAVYDLQNVGSIQANGTIYAGPYALLCSSCAAGYYQDAANGAYRSILGSGSNSGYYFQTNGGGATTMFVGLGGTYNGNVGIGTASPAVKLSIVSGTNGNPATSGTTQTNGIMRLAGNDNGVLDTGEYSGSGAFWMQATDKTTLAATYNLSLDPNGGDVGIGTASPGALLDVNGASDFRGLVTNTSGGFYISYSTSGSTAYGMNAPGSGYMGIGPVLVSSGVSGMALGYSTTGNGTLNPVLTVTQGGNVGIGTTAPVAEIHTVGTNTSLTNSNGSYTGGGTGYPGDAFWEGYSSIPGAGIGTNSDPSWNADGGDAGGLFYGGPGNYTAGGGAGLTAIGGAGGTYGQGGAGLYAQGGLNGSWWGPWDGQTYAPAAVFMDGNVGIGVVKPVYALDVAGQIHTSSGGIVFPDGTTQTTAFLGGSSQTITAGNVSAGSFGSNTGGGNYSFPGSIAVASNVNIDSNQLWTSAGALYLQYNSTQNTLINTTGGNVGIGTASPGYTLSVAGTADFTGALTVGGKLTVGTIDPVYAINGSNYATYNAAMTGEKEETTGLLDLACKKGVCSTTIDFNSLAQGSDLWLFGQATNLPSNLDNLIVILTPSFDGNTWYTKDAATGVLTVYGNQAGEVSYRFTAPRFDAAQWPNTAPASETANFTIP